MGSPLASLYQAPFAKWILNKMLKENKLKIAEMYNNGIELDNIAKTFERSKQTIVKILKEAGIKKPGLKNITHNQVKRIIELGEKGNTINEIAKIFKCNYITIYSIFKKAGIKIQRSQKTKKIPHEQRKKIFELSKKGNTVNEITKIFGYSHTTIYNILKENNIKTKYKYELEPNKIEQIRRMYLNGNSICKIAWDKNISISTVRRILSKNNIKREK